MSEPRNVESDSIPADELSASRAFVDPAPNPYLESDFAGLQDDEFSDQEEAGLV